MNTFKRSTDDVHVLDFMTYVEAKIIKDLTPSILKMTRRLNQQIIYTYLYFFNLKIN